VAQEIFADAAFFVLFNKEDLFRDKVEVHDIGLSFPVLLSFIVISITIIIIITPTPSPSALHPGP